MSFLGLFQSQFPAPRDDVPLSIGVVSILSATFPPYFRPSVHNQDKVGIPNVSVLHQEDQSGAEKNIDLDLGLIFHSVVAEWIHGSPASLIKWPSP